MRRGENMDEKSSCICITSGSRFSLMCESKSFSYALGAGDALDNYILFAQEDGIPHPEARVFPATASS